MEITLGHISIAGLIGILVGLSTLWVRRPRPITRSCTTGSAE